jgi:ribosomal protein S21
MTAITFPSQPAIEKFRDMQITITSPESELMARNHLTDVRLSLKWLTADIKALKEPHQAFIKSIDEAAAPWKSLLAERDQDLEKALLAYGRKVREAAELAQRKLMEQYEKKVERVEAKAIAQNKPIPVVLPPPIIATPPKSIETDSAKQTTMVVKKWRVRGVSDPTILTRADVAGVAIPDDLFVLDTARITKIIKAGGTVAGVENFTEETISVRAL